ncbi:class F sortase [Streptomyces sp. NPDC002845]
MAARPSSPTGNEAAPTEQRSRVAVMVLGAVAVLFLVVSLFGSHDTSSDASHPPRAAQSSASSPPTGQPATGRPPMGQPAAGQTAKRSSEQPAGKHLPRSKPLRLLIPKISVDAPFTELAVGPTGQLAAPPADDVNLVGWHAEGASPGEIGTSIVAGHVDTKTSPAVFVSLRELEKGDVFHVVRADGRKASFVVDSVETFDKEHFPDRRVYGDTAQAQVRLITCAGDYDRKAGDYTANLVVFAHLT